MCRRGEPGRLGRMSLFPNFPPTGRRGLRITMVLMSSICVLGAFTIFATGYEPGWEWITRLVVAGVALRLVAYFTPNRWLERLPKRG